MPIIYENKKDMQDGKEVSFPVKSIEVISESEAILNMIDQRTALGIQKQLRFIILMSGTEEGKNELKFKVDTIKKDLNTVSNKLHIKGDLIQAINFIAECSYISKDTQNEALLVISKFGQEERKESPTNIPHKY